MEVKKNPGRYAIISPMKDEALYIEATLRSIVSQTLLPDCWIIIDDGSTDSSPSIVEAYASKHYWIRLAKSGNHGKRDTNLAEIRAFNEALRQINPGQYDFIVKLDCDLRLSPDYFEKLLDKFSANEHLGIASGVYLEESLTGAWLHVSMPDYHAAGASKVVRSGCFRMIGGFVPYRGWDTVDEIRAQACGWETQHFRELEFFHLKKEGSGMGYLRTSRIQGEIFYVTGGGFFMLILRFFHRLVHGRPPVVSALVMLYGYLHSWLTRKKLLVSTDEAKAYRKKLQAHAFKMASGRAWQWAAPPAWRSSLRKR